MLRMLHFVDIIAHYADEMEARHQSAKAFQAKLLC